MRLRRRYLLVGVAWALFLAPVVTYFTLAFVLGVLWLYVFGDNPWPAALEGVILVIGSVVFISTAACSIYLAYRHGREREIKTEVDDPRERKRAILWGLAPIALCGITAVFIWQRSVERAETIAETEDRKTAFTDLMNARHTIAELAVDRTGDGDFEARVATSGGNPGPYSLHWQVNSMPYGEILSHEERRVEMDHEAGGLNFEISIDELARGYRDTVLNGGGVVVDEPFELVVTLQPEVNGDDVEAWPTFERHRWEQGKTPLGSSMTIDFPVLFRVEEDGTINHSTP